MRQQLRGDLDRHRQDLRPKIESALPLAELDGMRLSGFRSRLITNCLRTDQSAQRLGPCQSRRNATAGWHGGSRHSPNPKRTNYSHYLCAGRGKFFWMADATATICCGRRRRVWRASQLKEEVSDLRLPLVPVLLVFVVFIGPPGTKGIVRRRFC